VLKVVPTLELDIGLELACTDGLELKLELEAKAELLKDVEVRRCAVLELLVVEPLKLELEVDTGSERTLPPHTFEFDCGAPIELFM
jgi:hypothetical protein